MHFATEASLSASSSRALSEVRGLQGRVQTPSKWLPFQTCPRQSSLVQCKRASVQAVVTRHDASASARRKKDNSEDWADATAAVDHLSRDLRLVQWYPGHIAKAERDLKEQLKLVDVVVEVRDARCPAATTHPDIDRWVGDRPKVVVLNREDMVSAADRRAWAEHYGQQNVPLCFTDGQRGAGIPKLSRLALATGDSINKRRREKGLKPRAVRAAVLGFPNVGKSALINRLLKKRACESAPRPGVTRQLQWVRLGEGLDLLDAPGVLPPRIADQSAAARLAICNDIGEAAYAVAGVASVLVELVQRLPSAGHHVLFARYKIRSEGLSGEQYVEAVADRWHLGEVDRGALRILKDYRRGSFGWIALERPQQ